MIAELTAAAATARRLNALLRESLDLETFNRVVFELTKLNLDLMAAQAAALETVALQETQAARIRELESEVRDRRDRLEAPQMADRQVASR